MKFGWCLFTIAFTTATASADRLGHVQLSFKRTMTESHTAKKKQGAVCTDVETSHTSFVENATVGSESYPISDDGTDIAFQSGATLPAKGKPLTGTATYEFHADSTHDTCGTNVSTVFDAHAIGKIDDASIAAQYSRKSTQGTAGVDLGLRATQSTGTIKSHSPPSPEQKVDAAQMAAAQGDLLATSIGVANVNTAKQWALLGAALQQANELSANDEALTVTADANGVSFTLHETKNIPIAKLFPSDGNTQHSGKHTVTTELTISIGDTAKYDAIIEPLPSAPNAKLADYATFLPVGELPKKQGAPKADTTPDSVAFRVYIVDKDDPKQTKNPVPFEVTYTLDASKEPGIALNVPTTGGNTDPDLEWNAAVARETVIKQQTPTTLISMPEGGAKLIAIVRSRDFGAYGTLRADVRVKGGAAPLVAHMVGKKDALVTIPRDDNNNHIADAWESQQDPPLKDTSAKADKEHVDGNDHDGDGLTLYEEYRGALVHGKHVRLDPGKKDVFLVNTTALDLKGGAGLFETAAERSVKVRILDQDELDQNALVVNANSAIAYESAQHAILVKGRPGPWPEDKFRIAMTEPKDHKPTGGAAGLHNHGDNAAISPGDVKALTIRTDQGNGIGFDFAHELGHALGIHHHGDAPENALSDYAKPWYAVDENDQPITLGPQTKPSSPVGHAHSDASGDVACIMIYNQYYDAASIGLVVNDSKGAHAQYDATKGKGDSFWAAPLLMVTPFLPNGTSLCHGPKGTGPNATAKPWPAFGDAAGADDKGVPRGDCFRQLRVKDY